MAKQLQGCFNQLSKIGSCYIAMSATCCPFEACDPCYCMGEGEAPPAELVGKWVESKNSVGTNTNGMRGEASFEVHANGLISYKHYVFCYPYYGGPCGSTVYRVKVKGWNLQKMSAKGGNIPLKPEELAAANGHGHMAKQEVEGTILCCCKRKFTMDQSNGQGGSMGVIRFVPWRWHNEEKTFFKKEAGGEAGVANPAAVGQKVGQEAPATTGDAAAADTKPTQDGSPMNVEMER